VTAIQQEHLPMQRLQPWRLDGLAQQHLKH
jgi:hypothetical protein